MGCKYTYLFQTLFYESVGYQLSKSYWNNIKIVNQIEAWNLLDGFLVYIKIGRSLSDTSCRLWEINSISFGYLNPSEGCKVTKLI